MSTVSFSGLKIPSPFIKTVGTNAHDGQTLNDILDKLTSMFPATVILTKISSTYYAYKGDGARPTNGSGSTGSTVIQAGLDTLV